MCKQIPADLVLYTSSDSVDLELDLRACISNSLPAQVSAARPQTRL